MTRKGVSRAPIAFAIVALTVSGCAGMTPQQQRVLTGGAGGAAAGAVLGAIGGNAALGAVAGAGAGLLGGYLFDQYKQAQANAYQQGLRAGERRAARRE